MTARGGRSRPCAPVAEYELLGELVLDLTEVLNRERVAVPPPPVRQDAVGQHDHVPGLLLAVHHEPPEAVVLQPGHAPLMHVSLQRSLGARAGLDAHPIGVRRLLVAVMLNYGYRRLRALTLVEQIPELLGKALLAPPLAAHPPFVTHRHHLRASGSQVHDYTNPVGLVRCWP